VGRLDFADAVGVGVLPGVDDILFGDFEVAVRQIAGLAEGG